MLMVATHHDLENTQEIKKNIYNIADQSQNANFCKADSDNYVHIMVNSHHHPINSSAMLNISEWRYLVITRRN